MRSFMAAIRTIVLPWGRTSGERLVLDGVNGKIEVYDEDDTQVDLIDGDGIRVESNSGNYVWINPHSGLGVPFWDTSIELGRDDRSPAYIEARTTDAFSMRLTISSGSASDGGTYVDAGGGVVLTKSFATIGYDNDGESNYLTLTTDSSTINQPLSIESETWHNLAPAGTWINDGGAGNAPLGYTLKADGSVELRGAVRDGSTVAGTLIGTLPVGYRPTYNKRYVCPQQNTMTNYVGVRVETDGEIRANGLAGAFLSVDGIRFSRD